MSCVIATNLLGYLLVIAGPTAIFAATLYWTLTSSEPPLTSLQQQALSSLGVSEYMQRVVVGLFVVIALMVVTPVNYLLIRECHFGAVLAL